jgi:hypothetical protein
MSQPNPPQPEEDQKIIELKEQPEDTPKPAIPPRHLREIKHVNYSKYFSEDPDNSEDYQPEESSQKAEIPKKRTRPKSTNKNEASSKKKKTENQENVDNKMEMEEIKVVEGAQPNEAENQDRNNRNNNIYGTIVDVAEIMKKYNTTITPITISQENNLENANNNGPTPNVNNANNFNIPNSELILIMLEICLNSSQYGIDKDNSSRAFWEEVGKLDLLKPITTKFKPETLRKYWRTIREAKKFRKIITEIRRFRNELDNPNLKLLSSIKIICEYVSNASHRKFEYFYHKHLPPVKVKKITVEEMTPEQQISDILSTFKACFPKKKEKEILEVLYMTSFDIENTFLVLKDRDNLSFLLFTEKDDEIVSKSWEEKNESSDEYQDVVNIKGLEEVLRRKEFLFGVKIDRDEYNKEIEIVEEINNENNDEQVENKAENQNADKDKVIIIEETNEKLKNIDKELVKDDKENKDKKEEEKKE